MRDENDWNRDWGGRRLRKPSDEIAVDFGKALELPDLKILGFAVEPLKWQDYMYKLFGDQCPLCGKDTDLKERSPIGFDLVWGHDQLSVGCSAWAHDRCVEECPATEEIAKVPW